MELDAPISWVLSHLIRKKGEMRNWKTDRQLHWMISDLAFQVTIPVFTLANVDSLLVHRNNHQ